MYESSTKPGCWLLYKTSLAAKLQNASTLVKKRINHVVHLCLFSAREKWKQEIHVYKSGKGRRGTAYSPRGRSNSFVGGRGIEGLLAWKSLRKQMEVSLLVQLSWQWKVVDYWEQRALILLSGTPSPLLSPWATYKGIQPGLSAHL